MRDLLRLCAEMDTFAEEVYARLADATADERLATTFRSMGAEEAEHVEWWRSLLDSWDEGLIPDIFPDSEELESRMRGLFADMRASVPGDLTPSSPAEMLTVASRLEFYMLDPTFSELLALTEPGSVAPRRDAYEQHVGRLIGEMVRRAPEDTQLGFLGKVLERAWADGVALARHSLRDPLTGLLNRRAFSDHLRQLSSWAARYGRPLAVLLVDVDNFKVVNDSFGHAAGDLVLQRVASALGSTVRDADLVARYGGDEFAVLAPETEAVDAERLSKRLVESVRGSSVEWDGRTIAVTVSVGCAVCRRACEDSAASELVAAADQSMYAAKTAGRNRAGNPHMLGVPAA